MPKQGKAARSLDAALFVISIGADCVSIARAQHLNKNGVTRAFAPLHYTTNTGMNSIFLKEVSTKGMPDLK